MPATNSSNWAMSLSGQSQIVTGNDEINQAFTLLFQTQKRSDPTRPDFGIDHLAYLDKPVNVVAPAIVLEIFQQGALYISRAPILSVTYTINVSKITYLVTYQTANGTSTVNLTN